jgi:hypothetical protein
MIARLREVIGERTQEREDEAGAVVGMEGGETYWRII